MLLSSRFTFALVYAAELHQEQERKISGVPYVAHLLRVAGIVMEYGGNEDEAIAALLHDAVEDQGGIPVLDEIRRRFGEAVAETVLGCSDAHARPKPPWHDRKQAHVDHIRVAPPSTRLVVAADKLDNARSLLREYRVRGESLWNFFHGGRNGTLWYYDAMLAALKDAGITPLVEEFERTLAEICRIADEGMTKSEI
ncbi:MAG: HD domain-containing protein [Thermoguttaceae bacterium]|jgi:GTP pyrophosphokinase